MQVHTSIQTSERSKYVNDVLDEHVPSYISSYSSGT